MIYVYSIATAALAGLAILATAGVRRLWRNESRVWDSQHAWWAWGETMWHGWIRALPSFVVAGWAMILSVASGLIAVAADGGDGTGPLGVLKWMFVAFAGVAAVAFATGISVTLFARPKLVIPPHLRRQRGVLARHRSTNVG